MLALGRVARDARRRVIAAVCHFGESSPWNSDVRARDASQSREQRGYLLPGNLTLIGFESFSLLFGHSTCCGLPGLQRSVSMPRFFTVYTRY